MPETKRVLLVSDFTPPVRGGLEFHVIALAQALSARGHDVLVATMTPRPSAIQRPAVTVQPVRSWSRHLPHDDPDRPFHTPLPDPLARHDLAHVIKTFRPDVIHGHSWLSASLPRHSVPFVLTAHDYGLICPIRTLFHASGSQCSGPKLGKCTRCANHALGPLKAPLLSLSTPVGRALLHPDAVLAVSTAVADALRPRLNSPVHVVPNFVDVEPPRVPLPPEVPEQPFVMYAGDPGDHKGVPDLIAVWRSPRPPAMPLLLAVTRPLTIALPPNVVTTSMTREQVASAWRVATIAAVPSRWADPCPTTAIEAIRAGVPVVAANTGGLPDIVRDGIDGLLVPPSNPDALGAAIHRLVDDELLRTRMGHAAAAGSNRFQAAEVVGQIEAVYSAVTRFSPALTK